MRYSKADRDQAVQIAQSDFARRLDLVIDLLIAGRAGELPQDLQMRVGRRMHQLVYRGQPLLNRCYARPKREAARDHLVVSAALLIDRTWVPERLARVIADIVQGKISKHAYPEAYEKLSAAEDIEQVPRSVRMIAGILRRSGNFPARVTRNGKISP